MKPKLILIAHGMYAPQLYESAKMVVGEIEGLYTVPMLENDGLEGTVKKMEAVFAEIGNDTPAVIVADMFAGTPCNVAVQMMYQKENVRILTGLNLPMAIEYAVSDIEDLDEMAEFLKDVGLEAVKILEKPEINEEEGGYED